MTQLDDINAACLTFSQSHDRDADPFTGLGLYRCVHFGPWAESLLPEGRLSDVQRAKLALDSDGPDRQILACLRLLESSNVPQSWIGAIEAISACEGGARIAVTWAAVEALYGDIADRLSLPLSRHEDAVALGHLVEATTYLENWVTTTDTSAFNYRPMGDVNAWWQDYLDRIDAWVTPNDLHVLSEQAGGATETEALSSITPPERLAEIYRTSQFAVVANPRLPASTVNESMADDWDLLFHPNADPERSWTIIRQELEDGNGEDLADHVSREFMDMRDDSWAIWSGFTIDGPHAALLRRRIAAWCRENIEDEDDRDELLEEFGIFDADMPGAPPIVSDPSLRRGVASNASVPPGLLADLARDADKYVRAAVAGNSNTPVEILTTLARDSKRYVRQAVAGNSNTPLRILTTLAGDKQAWVRTYVARNPATPVELLVALAGDSDPGVRQTVAYHAATPAEVLTTLAHDPDSGVRRYVAENSTTPVDVLAGFAGDPDPGVRQGTVRNPNAPTDVLVTLIADDSSYVRGQLARSPSAPPDVLISLSRDNDLADSVASNPAVPLDLLVTLSRDPNPSVRSSVARNPKSPVEVLRLLAGDPNAGVRSDAAGNAATPAEVLVALAGDASEYVRRELGGNPSTPAKLQTVLAADPDPGVRRAVAQNSYSPVDIFATLVADVDVDVRQALAWNPSTPGDVLAALAGDVVSDVRVGVAHNPSTSGDNLADLAHDADARVIWAVSRNPNTPIAILISLAGL